MFADPEIVSLTLYFIVRYLRLFYDISFCTKPSLKKSECLCLIEMKNRMPKSSHKGLKPSFELITKYSKYLMLVTIQ